MTPNKRYKNKLRISVFDEDGNKISRYSSFHDFRAYSGIRRKINPKQSRLLKKGELIYFQNYLIGLTKIFKGKKYIDPLICKTLLRRYNGIKNKNKRRLRVIYNAKQLQIIILDGFMRYIGCHNGTIEELSKKTKIAEGTIKASLSRAVEYADKRNPRVNTRYYVYLKDLHKIIK